MFEVWLAGYHGVVSESRYIAVSEGQYKVAATA